MRRKRSQKGPQATVGLLLLLWAAALQPSCSRVVTQALQGPLCERDADCSGLLKCVWGICTSGIPEWSPGEVWAEPSNENPGAEKLLEGAHEQLPDATEPPRPEPTRPDEGSAADAAPEPGPPDVSPREPDPPEPRPADPSPPDPREPVREAAPEPVCPATCSRDAQCQIAACGARNRCHISGQCRQPKACNYDHECQSGQICSSKLCVTGCRYQHQCSKGTICEQRKCIVGCLYDHQCSKGTICLQKMCRTGCRYSHECPRGFDCKDNRCISRAQCQADKDCTKPAVCHQKKCYRYGCRKDRDCPRDSPTCYSTSGPIGICGK